MGNCTSKGHDNTQAPEAATESDGEERIKRLQSKPLRQSTSPPTIDIGTSAAQHEEVAVGIRKQEQSQHAVVDRTNNDVADNKKQEQTKKKLDNPKKSASKTKSRKSTSKRKGKSKSKPSKQEEASRPTNAEPSVVPKEEVVQNGDVADANQQEHLVCPDKPSLESKAKKYGRRASEHREQKAEAEVAVDKALSDLQPYRNKPLTKSDKVLVMQGWNKALAFKTAFSEALLICWRVMCCDHEINESEKKSDSAMNIVEKNKDPIFDCFRDRMADAEELLMGVLDGAVRSLCPAHQVVQREAYRPMLDDATLQRSQQPEFTLECQTLQDHLALFARLGIAPKFWVCFVNAVVWTMKTHAPYAQDDDLEDLEQGVFGSAFGRTVALTVAIPAVGAYKDLITLHKAPVVHQIQEIWGRLSATSIIDFGEAFYRKLLSDYPQLLDYFARTNMDALAVHLTMSLDLVIKNIHALGSGGSFRQALEKLGQVHLKMNVPTYSYSLVGATILDAFEPVFVQEEIDTKDSDDPVSAKALRSGLTKVYEEIMSVVYYPMFRQEKLIGTARDFYDQIKVELNWSDAELNRRFSEVEEEVASTGTYTQTTAELEIGARLASVIFAKAEFLGIH